MGSITARHAAARHAATHRLHCTPRRRTPRSRSPHATPPAATPPSAPCYATPPAPHATPPPCSRRTHCRATPKAPPRRTPRRSMPRRHPLQPPTTPRHAAARHARCNFDAGRCRRRLGLFFCRHGIVGHLWRVVICQPVSIGSSLQTCGPSISMTSMQGPCCNTGLARTALCTGRVAVGKRFLRRDVPCFVFIYASTLPRSNDSAV